MFLADAAQRVPYVLYISAQQKLQFEFEKNLKIILTICIPQKYFSCISTFSWLSRSKIPLLPQIFLLNVQTYLGI